MPYDGDSCPVCGELERASAAPCLPCRVDPPPWTAAVSFGAYDGALRDLVLLFKAGRRDELAAPLGDRLADAWEASGFPVVDAITAVPMRWSRRLRRGFDQAELLGRRLAARSGIPYRRLLRRVGRSRQTGRGRAARRSLPVGEFAPRAGVPSSVALVDDVLTTGGTVSAASRALRRAGAADVYVITLARTPRSGRIP